jgi:hypothetical protein
MRCDVIYGSTLSTHNEPWWPSIRLCANCRPPLPVRKWWNMEVLTVLYAALSTSLTESWITRYSKVPNLSPPDVSMLWNGMRFPEHLQPIFLTIKEMFYAWSPPFVFQVNFSTFILTYDKRGRLSYHLTHRQTDWFSLARRLLFSPKIKTSSNYDLPPNHLTQLWISCHW